MDTNKTDNTSEIKSAEQTETDSTKNASTPSVEETKQQPNATKAYSDRLNKERAKIKEEAEKEAQLTVAKEAGYDSWEDYQKNKRNEKLTTMGFNPDQIAPVIDEFIQKDPRYIDIQRKEEERQKLLQ